MDLQFIATVALPIALAIIMFGLGLHLSVEDFKRVLKFPKPIFIGLVCQLFLMPAVAIGLCYAFQLEPLFAIGLVLLASSPGGVVANIYAHLAKGDVALTLTLTAVNSILSAVSIPVITGIGIYLFSTEDQTVGMQFSKMIQVFLIILVPVSIGLVVHSKFPAFSQKMDKPVRIFSIVVLAAIIIVAVQNEWQLLVDHFAEITGVVLTFNLLSLLFGYTIPRYFNVSAFQAKAISFEIGIHNGTVALYIAISVLGSTMIAVPAAFYSVIMFFTAGALVLVFKKQD